MKWNFKCRTSGVLSVTFVSLSVFLSWGRFLRRLPGWVFARIGGFCGLWLRFRWGHLYLRGCGLCTVDRCKDYGRLQGTKRSVYIRWLNRVTQNVTMTTEDRIAVDKKQNREYTVIPLWTGRLIVVDCFSPHPAWPLKRQLSLNVVRGIPVHSPMFA